MEKKSKPAELQTCPVARSAALLGDEWIMLVLRALFRGAQRFDDLQKQTGAATNILTIRLNKLIENGMVAKTPYQERPVRYKYGLTERGFALFPVVLELMKFGNKWLPCDAPPMKLYHTECGQLSEPGQTCTACGGQLKLGNVKTVEG